MTSPTFKCWKRTPSTYLHSSADSSAPAELSSNGEDPEDKGELVVKSTKSVLKWPNGKTLSVHHDDRMHLPQVRAYKNVIDTASALALKGNVDDETNQNLTSAQKTLLRWHF